jgi:hypothetical protein
MKNFILTFIAVVNLFTFSSGTAAKLEEIYPLTTVVVDVDTETDVVTVQDFNGNLWTFYGVEDWIEGDICSLTMYKSGTEIIYDDQIIQTRYSGYFDGWNN